MSAVPIITTFISDGSRPPMPAPLTHVPMYSTGNGPNRADIPPRKKIENTQMSSQG